MPATETSPHAPTAEPAPHTATTRTLLRDLRPTDVSRALVIQRILAAEDSDGPAALEFSSSI